MDDCPRFTTEQVLRGIQAYVDKQFGHEFPLDPDASVSVYYETVQKEMGCSLEFLTEIGHYFGLRWDHRRWQVWLRLPREKRGEKISSAQGRQLWQEWLTETSQPLTIRKLAEFIARHAHGAPMNPTTVFGVPCAPAGAFRGLCQLPEVRGRRIAPSTKLRDVLRGGRLRAFWSRSTWASGIELPLLSPTKAETWLGRSYGAALFAGLALATMTGGMILGDWNLSALCPAFIAAIALPSVLFCFTAAALDCVRDPLPDGVRTFGDLARLIANAQTGA
ncbi:hypothetical protein NG895_07255 [Aeoliella sp. ICT_H6.2]|uniref:Uncharacterized protein n=1 Tax=Aeoliella straminimaris TaxID=2954799 RepID=A0A9X2F7F4_9BACT|nr:hypothetical protein [Aeoliella straminimaris]MCO6043700.1 hypothetical protein [Aeoliella straminimaris]